jgi:hypothetical protein
MNTSKYLKITIHKVKINTSDSFFMRFEFLKQSFETMRIIKETEMNKVIIYKIRLISLK